jgi:hypothetical protein
MDTLEARGVVAGFLLLATNVPISAVNLMRTGDNLSAGVHYVTKLPRVKKVTPIFRKNHPKSLIGLESTGRYQVEAYHFLPPVCLRVVIFLIPMRMDKPLY